MFLRLPFFGAKPVERLEALSLVFTGFLSGFASFHTSLFLFRPPLPPLIRISAVKEKLWFMLPDRIAKLLDPT